MVRAGYIVSIPWGDSCRYDLIIDDGERLLRVQCKRANWNQGAITFYTYSFSGVKGTIKRDYKDDIEIFAVWSPHTDKVYLIPIEEVMAEQPHLRVDPPANNQKKGICWAKDYELDSVAQW